MQSFKSPEEKTLEAVETTELGQSVSHVVWLKTTSLVSFFPLSISLLSPTSLIPFFLTCTILPLPCQKTFQVLSIAKVVTESQTRGDEGPHRVIWLYLSIFWEACQCTREMLQIAGWTSSVLWTNIYHPQDATAQPGSK